MRSAHVKPASHVMVTHFFLSRDIAMHGGIKKNLVSSTV